MLQPTHELGRRFDLCLLMPETLSTLTPIGRLFLRGEVEHLFELLLAQPNDRSSGSAEWRSSFSSQRGKVMPSHFMNSSVFTEPQGANVNRMGTGASCFDASSSA